MSEAAEVEAPAPASPGGGEKRTQANTTTPERAAAASTLASVADSTAPPPAPSTAANGAPAPGAAAPGVNMQYPIQQQQQQQQRGPPAPFAQQPPSYAAHAGHPGAYPPHLFGPPAAHQQQYARGGGPYHPHQLPPGYPSAPPPGYPAVGYPFPPQAYHPASHPGHPAPPPGAVPPTGHPYPAQQQQQQQPPSAQSSSSGPPPQRKPSEDATKSDGGADDDAAKAAAAAAAAAASADSSKANGVAAPAGGSHAQPPPPSTLSTSTYPSTAGTSAPIPVSSAIAAAAQGSPDDKEGELVNKVEPMRQDFHFYTLDKKEELLAAAKETVRQAVAKTKGGAETGAEGEGKDDEEAEEEDPYLVMTNLNERLIAAWQIEPQAARIRYLSKEEADRKRFMLDDEVASRHCATLTARSRSPKTTKKEYGFVPAQPNVAAQAHAQAIPAQPNAATHAQAMPSQPNVTAHPAVPAIPPMKGAVGYFVEESKETKKRPAPINDADGARSGDIGEKKSRGDDNEAGPDEKSDEKKSA